jgi:hypothetical protein
MIDPPAMMKHLPENFRGCSMKRRQSSFIYIGYTLISPLHKIIFKRFCAALLLLLLFFYSEAQRKSKSSMKDSLDGKFDLSDFIIDANGFIPVPIIITEPALGNFGFGIAPVFIHKKRPVLVDGEYKNLPPDVSAGFGAYTANSSWLIGGGRMATISKWRLRYRVAAAYADINLSFFRNVANEGEKEFRFNFKSVPIFLNVNRQLKDLRWLYGIQYTFLHSKLSLADSSVLADFVKEEEVNSSISELGFVGEFDDRDNIFTPSNGLKAHIHVNFSENFLGSDFDYQRINSFLYWFYRISQNRSTGKAWISGLRFDFQQMLGNPPFYIVPSIDLRGVPALRYQGKTNVLIETEQRWDFVRRWSLVMFGGLAKAFDHYDDFGDAALVYNYGAGFRYLIARKFNVRMGLDLAKGPDRWAYYIIFGSAWRKQ